jgi:RimJ/RimL family protein N-acetyltransferase
VLREALFKNGRFESLVVMSILRSEWPPDRS